MQQQQQQQAPGEAYGMKVDKKQQEENMKMAAGAAQYFGLAGPGVPMMRGPGGESRIGAGMAPVSLAADFDAAEMHGKGGPMGWLEGQQRNGNAVGGMMSMLENNNNSNQSGMMSNGGLGGVGGVVTPTKIKSPNEEPPTTNYKEEQLLEG